MAHIILDDPIIGYLNLRYLSEKKLTHDQKFSCNFCAYKRVPKKRPKLNAVGIQIQSENFEIEDVSPQLAENVTSEKLEDELEEIVPFEQTPILKTVEAESTNPNIQKPRGWYLNKRYIADIKCGICDSTFENRLIYDAHMMSVHMVNPYNCLLCPNASFTTHHLLKKHQDEFHDGKMAKDTKTDWPCDIPGCEYVGKDKRNLYRHKATHSTERPWKCNQCDYTCKIKNSLIVHQEMVYENFTVN